MTTSYITYVYYSTTYMGSLIAPEDFVTLALQASATIDQITFGRAAVVVAAALLDDVIDAIKMATCAVAEELQALGSGIGGGIQSESVGSHSVSYGSGSPATLTYKERLTRAASLYLSNSSVDLLYKGFGPGELGGVFNADEL